MQDAGMAMLESFDADIHDNTFTNVKYGIRISLGGGNNNVYDNVFDQCSTCEYRTHPCGVIEAQLSSHNYTRRTRPRCTDNGLQKHECAWNARRFSPFTRYPSIYPSTPRVSRHMTSFADGLYTYQGSDAPEASSDGRPSDNSFYDNTISNTKTGVKIKEADNTIITGEI